MKCLIILSLIFICNCSYSQSGKPIRNITDLAKDINSQFHSEDEKVLAAYRWITQNIRYSEDDFLQINRGLNTRAVIDVAFEKRKGVCENFSSIFTDVIQKMGFESVVIEGYTRINQTTDQRGHSWSAVKFTDDWYLFDPTWDAGSSNVFAYFKKPGTEFIHTHISFDPMWQLIDRPFTYREFEAGQKISGSIYFNYKDSIQKYRNSDSLTYYLAAIFRIEKSGKRNRAAELHYKILKGYVEDHREEDQMTWFNRAVTLLNQSRDQLNQFISYRNDFFQPVRPDAELKLMLEGIENKVSDALLLFDKVDASEAALVYGTQPARDQVRKFVSTFQDQKLFLNTYLSTDVAKRKDLFFKK